MPFPGIVVALAVLLCASAMSGCASGERTAPAEASGAGYVACTAPRPKVCTYEYRPVCAKVDTGKRCISVPCDSSFEDTRGNACAACSDPKVMGYREGACGPQRAR
jgi:hypothetical protein